VSAIAAEREARAKLVQDYDDNPPRCATCVYFRCEPLVRHVERHVKGRSGRVRVQQVRIKKHPIKNPLVDRCTFGNFLIKRSGVCNEWHSRDGERIVEAANEVG
jgi:hypothetical protein